MPEDVDLDNISQTAAVCSKVQISMQQAGVVHKLGRDLKYENRHFNPAQTSTYPSSTSRSIFRSLYILDVCTYVDTDAVKYLFPARKLSASRGPKSSGKVHNYA